MMEPRWSWLLIALAGTSLGVVGYAWGLSSVPKKREVAVTSDAERIAALEREVQSLRAKNRQAALAARQAPAEPAVNTAVATELRPADEVFDDSPEDAALEQVDPKEQERRLEQARIEHFDGLSRRVDTELVDARWRHETEQPLKQLMSKHLGPDFTVSEATCASTLCRVKLAHPAWPRIPTAKMFEFDMARVSLEVTEISFDNRAAGTTTLYLKRGPAPASIPAATDSG